MQFDKIKREFVLSTGRIIPCHSGQLPISVDDGSIDAIQDFGECLPLGWDSDATDGRPESVFTTGERAEIADFMIALWTRYKEAK